MGGQPASLHQCSEHYLTALGLQPSTSIVVGRSHKAENLHHEATYYSPSVKRPIKVLGVAVVRSQPCSRRQVATLQPSQGFLVALRSKLNRDKEACGEAAFPLTFAWSVRR